MSAMTPSESRLSTEFSDKTTSRWPKYLFGSVLLLSAAGVLALGKVSPQQLFLSALTAGVVLLAGLWVRWRKMWRVKLLALFGVIMSVLACTGVAVYAYFSDRYRIAEVMEVPITEFSNVQYPEDPAHWSTHYSNYNGRKLKLVQKDATHFDFILEPLHPFIAKIEILNVDVSLMTPSLPKWAKEDAGLQRIALTDRQWNRQQVSFPATSPHVIVTGGDGFEEQNIDSIELAKNCLNAGLWEVLLYVKDKEGKALYYQGWITFPLGHYKHIFEHNTGLSYADHWYNLEHWSDPAGTVVPMDKLRKVLDEHAVEKKFDLTERVLVEGEQINKRRTTLADDIRVWGDYFDGRKIQYASFVPPGRYSVEVPRDTQYSKLDRFDKAIMRSVQSPASDKPLSELELVFSSSKHPGKCRFFVSGIDLSRIPTLPINDYPKGFYMPMGIGTPPFHQSYEELVNSPPEKSSYVSVLLDENDGWIDHHAVGIDGPVLHFDQDDPSLLHVYLLSYERHCLIAHFVVEFGMEVKPESDQSAT